MFFLQTFDKVRILSGQPESASYLAWSPDDTKLLMCGVDAALRLWDPMTGELVHTYSEHKEQVTCCVWLPDGEHFISGACDKSMCLWVKHLPMKKISRAWDVSGSFFLGV